MAVGRMGNTQRVVLSARTSLSARRQRSSSAPQRGGTRREALRMVGIQIAAARYRLRWRTHWQLWWTQGHAVEYDTREAVSAI